MGRMSSSPLTRAEQAMVVQGEHFQVPLDTLLMMILTTAQLWFNSTSSAFVVTLLALYIVLGFFFPQMSDEVALPRRVDRFIFSIRLFIVLVVLMVAAGVPTLFN